MSEFPALFYGIGTTVYELTRYRNDTIPSNCKSLDLKNNKNVFFWIKANHLFKKSEKCKNICGVPICTTEGYSTVAHLCSFNYSTQKANKASIFNCIDTKIKQLSKIFELVYFLLTFYF